MRIYIGELQHVEMKTRPGRFVPLAAGYLSSYVKGLIPGVEVKIFTDAIKLLDAVDDKRPDVIGLSVRFWSEKLSFFCAEKIKQNFPQTVIVAGGPSIDDIDTEVTRFLQNHPYFDACIPNEGEIGFLSLIQSIMKNGGGQLEHGVDGCWTLDSEGTLHKGKYATVDLPDLPSPYLDGTLDQFLEDGFDVLMETTRGCPYRCKFCVDGSFNTIKVRRAPMEHVKAEFEYLKSRATADFMMITDLNFGILGKRDVEVAKMINASHRSGAFPRLLSAYSFKYLNADNREIALMFKDQSERTIAFQSMDESVVEEVGRYNLKLEDFEDDLEWAQKNGVDLNAEFIFGFSGEKTDSFINNIEGLIRNGANRILLYNLKLISGSDLYVPVFRDKYQFKSKFRRFGRNYGVYRGEPVVETEEIVVGADTFDFANFMQIRRYGLFLNTCLMLGYFGELIDILLRIGLPGEKLVRFLSEEAISFGEHLSKLMTEYEQRANAELFDTHEEAVAQEAPLLTRNVKLPEARLDWIFVGKMIIEVKVRADLFKLVSKFVRSYSSNPIVVDLVDEYLLNVLDKKILTFDRGEPESVKIKTKVDISGLREFGKLEPKNIIKAEPTECLLHMKPRAVEFITKYHESSEFELNEATIQDIFVSLGSTSNNCLLREVEQNFA